MCKVFIMTNFSKVKKINRAVDTISKALAQYESDGIGYSILGVNGIYGERSLAAESFKARFDAMELETGFTEKNYNRFGIKGKTCGGAMFHGRTSTNDKTLLNTHPINKHGWSLIHNGVVTDHGPKYKMITTNDTEHVLENLVRGGIHEVAKNLTGYYAIGAIDPNGNMHIARDSTANLFAARLEHLESFVFATTQSLIEDVCEELGWSYSTVEPVKTNTYLVFDPAGELKEHSNFSPRGSGWSEDRWAGLSLGRQIEEQKTASLVPESIIDTNDDEAMFLSEVGQIDASYTVLDYYGAPIGTEEFLALEDEDKIYCTVVRGDGTIVSPYDYHTEKLYDGFAR